MDGGGLKLEKVGLVTFSSCDDTAKKIIPPPQKKYIYIYLLHNWAFCVWVKILNNDFYTELT